jgi:hypothetical protein
MIHLTCVYEDEPTHLVMLKMLEQFPGCFNESTSISCHGFGKIKKNIKAYNNAARYGYYFMLCEICFEFFGILEYIKKNMHTIYGKHYKGHLWKLFKIGGNCDMINS